MKVTVKKEPKSQVVLTIRIEEDDLKKYESQALKKLSQKVKVKGFRPGKVPEAVIRKQLGEDVIKMETIDVALPQTYAEAIAQEKIQVLSTPQIEFQEPEKDSTDIVYTATAAIFPEITVGDYKKISVKDEKVTVEDTEVQDILDNVLKQHTVFSEAGDDTKAAKGDRIEVDFDGFDEKGVALDGTSSKNHPIVLGDGGYIEGFEDNIIGMKKGESKEFTVTFPKDYAQESFQNKKVTFKIHLHKIENPKTPEFDEKFIEQVSGKKQTLDEMKKDISEGLMKQKELDSSKKKEVDFLEEIIKITQVDLAPQIIEEEIDFILQDIKMDLQSKGLKYEDYLEYLKKTEAEHRGEYTEEAEKRLILRFALRKIYEAENYEVSDDEVSAEIEKMLEAYPENKRDEARAQYDKRGATLHKQLKNKIMLDKLLDTYLYKK